MHYAYCTGCKYGDHIAGCEQYAAYDCYTNSTAEDCCGTCAKHHTGKVGCEYGEKPDCENISKSECYKKEADCCVTCPKLKDGPKGKMRHRSNFIINFSVTSVVV